MAARLRVAVDVGGTFTDIFVLDEDTGVISVAKVPSTPTDPMDARDRRRRGAANVDLRDVVVFSHGTTVATNALITRNFPRAAMVSTTGLPRRDRDPPRHEGRPLGRLQGRRRRRTSAAATASRWRERVDYDGEVLEARRRGRRAPRRRGAAQARHRGGRRLLRQLLRQPGERAPHAGDPRGGAPRRQHLHLERHPARRSSSTSASRRPSPTPCSRR